VYGPDHARAQVNMKTRFNQKIGVLLFASAAENDIIMAVVNVQAAQSATMEDVYEPTAELNAEVLAAIAARTAGQHKPPHIFFCASKTAYFTAELFTAVSFFFPLCFFFLCRLIFFHTIFSCFYRNWDACQAMAKFAQVIGTRHQFSKRTHVFLDNCRIHDDPRLAIELLTRNIVLWFLPRNTTHFSQPLDVWVIAAVKNIHRSLLREYVECANVSNTVTNKSMALIFIVEALTTLRAARSTRPSFIHVGLGGGRIDVDAALDLFNRRARGDTTGAASASAQTKAKSAYNPVNLTRQSLLINEAVNTIKATRDEAANRTQATNDRLTVMPPIRKNVLVSAVQIAEAAVEHVRGELPVRIAAAQKRLDAAHKKLKNQLNRCRVCDVTKRVGAAAANWRVCACGEYIMCASHLAHLPFPVHCGANADQIHERAALKSARADVINERAAIEHLQAELASTEGLRHTPKGKTTKSTHNARVTKATRGSFGLLSKYDQYADPKTMRLMLRPVQPTPTPTPTTDKKRKAEDKEPAPVQKKPKKAPPKKAPPPVVDDEDADVDDKVVAGQEEDDNDDDDDDDDDDVDVDDEDDEDDVDEDDGNASVSEDGGSFDDTSEIRALQRAQKRGGRPRHSQSWKDLFDNGVLQK
jgi:hypothetical protein